MDTVAERSPGIVGWNTTETVHADPEATVTPVQVSNGMLKSVPAGIPTEVTCKDIPPELVTVKVWAALADPISWLAKLSVVEDRVAKGGRTILKTTPPPPDPPPVVVP
jgi:hypothetical protein